MQSWITMLVITESSSQSVMTLKKSFDWRATLRPFIGIFERQVVYKFYDYYYGDLYCLRWCVVLCNALLYWRTNTICTTRTIQHVSAHLSLTHYYSIIMLQTAVLISPYSNLIIIDNQFVYHCIICLLDTATQELSIILSSNNDALNAQRFHHTNTKNNNILRPWLYPDYPSFHLRLNNVLNLSRFHQPHQRHQCSESSRGSIDKDVRTPWASV